MDSKDRDESLIRRREAALAQRLGEALDQLNPQSAKDCPDAEVIAAYAERALGADESAQCENHFAACDRCRNILRVLVAASDAPLAEKEVAQLGQRVAAVRAPVEITPAAAKRPRSKAVDWSKRWLAPAFGIAAVLTVWFVMRPPWRGMGRSTSPTLLAQAPREEMPESAPPFAVERAEKPTPTPEVPAVKMGSPNLKTAPSANVNLKPRDELQGVSPSAGVAENLPQEKKESAELAEKNKTKSLAAPSAPPAPSRSAISSAINPSAPLPQARAQADSAVAAASEAPRSSSQSVTVAEAAPIVGGTNGSVAGTVRQQPATDLPVNGRNFQALNRMRAYRATPIILKSSTGSIFWRAGIAGVIERSTDAGKTWSQQISPSKEDWLSGAAISDAVCWIAGRNGAIARTMDGERWERIAPPVQASAAEGKLPDWISITANDAQSATITSNNGNKFATSDGGKTWQQQ